MPRYFVKMQFFMASTAINILKQMEICNNILLWLWVLINDPSWDSEESSRHNGFIKIDADDLEVLTDKLRQHNVHLNVGVLENGIDEAWAEMVHALKKPARYRTDHMAWARDNTAFQQGKPPEGMDAACLFTMNGTAETGQNQERKYAEFALQFGFHLKSHTGPQGPRRSEDLGVPEDMPAMFSSVEFNVRIDTTPRGVSVHRDITVTRKCSESAEDWLWLILYGTIAKRLEATFALLAMRLGPVEPLEGVARLGQVHEDVGARFAGPQSIFPDQGFRISIFSSHTPQFMHSDGQRIQLRFDLKTREEDLEYLPPKKTVFDMVREALLKCWKEYLRPHSVRATDFLISGLLWAEDWAFRRTDFLAQRLLVSFQLG
eukprot:jgi/Botrbrau1/649/Bobra.0161s0038.1